MRTLLAKRDASSRLQPSPRFEAATPDRFTCRSLSLSHSALLPQSLRRASDQRPFPRSVFGGGNSGRRHRRRFLCHHRQSRAHAASECRSRDEERGTNFERKGRSVTDTRLRVYMCVYACVLCACATAESASFFPGKARGDREREGGSSSVREGRVQ